MFGMRLGYVPEKKPQQRSEMITLLLINNCAICVFTKKDLCASGDMPTLIKFGLKSKSFILRVEIKSKCNPYLTKMIYFMAPKQVPLQVSLLHSLLSMLFFFHSEVIIVFFYYQLFDHVSLKPSRETLLCQMAQISIHNPE